MSRRRRMQGLVLSSASFNTQRLSNTEKVREQLHQHLLTMPPVAFEQIIAQLLTACGYEQVQVLAASTRGSATTLLPATEPSDSGARSTGVRSASTRTASASRKGTAVRGGADFTAVSEQGTFSGLILVQAKQYRIPVSRRFVDELRGAMLRSGAQQGVLITTSTFYGPALQAVALPSAWPVRLIEGRELLGQLLEYHIGVRQTASGRWRLDRDYLEQLSSRCVSDESLVSAKPQLPSSAKFAQNASSRSVATKPKRTRYERTKSQNRVPEPTLGKVDLSSHVQATSGLWHKCRALWQRFWGLESCGADQSVNDDR